MESGNTYLVMPGFFCTSSFFKILPWGYFIIHFLKIALCYTIVWITCNLPIFILVYHVFSSFLILWIKCYGFFYGHIHSSLDILKRGIVGLHGKVMLSSSRYCGCPNIYSTAIYSMKVSIAAILSNTWYSQIFRYLAILSDM